MVIPRPLDDLEQTLPVSSCWLDKPQPLSLPVEFKETQKELLELPDLTQLPAPAPKLE